MDKNTEIIMSVVVINLLLLVIAAIIIVVMISKLNLKKLERCVNDYCNDIRPVLKDSLCSFLVPVCKSKSQKPGEQLPKYCNQLEYCESISPTVSPNK